jgi:hypothetical protein
MAEDPDMTERAAASLRACGIPRWLPLVFLALPALAQAVAVRDSPSCGEWVKARVDVATPQPETQIVERWLIGFLSGIAVGTRLDLLHGTDSASLYSWMDDYCRANPLRSVAEGTPALVAELRNKVKRRHPAGPPTA